MLHDKRTGTMSVRFQFPFNMLFPLKTLFEFQDLTERIRSIWNTKVYFRLTSGPIPVFVSKTIIQSLDGDKVATKNYT